jgi:hypothetical protein
MVLSAAHLPFVVAVEMCAFPTAVSALIALRVWLRRSLFARVMVEI